MCTSEYDHQYTYNEEYTCTIPINHLVEPVVYLASSDSEDSQDDSSSFSSDYEGETYFDKLCRSRPPNFLEMERQDDESDLIIPLETDDADFGNIETDRNGQMTCTTCSLVFSSKLRFGIHRRRHFALDHFVCPVCFKGFTNLSQCQAHELKEHKQDKDPTSGGRNYTFRTRNARKTQTYTETPEFCEEDVICAVPSTSLYPYRGPEVKGIYGSYEVEVKCGRRERKSHCIMQSKYVLECQKQKKRETELKLKEVARSNAAKEKKKEKLRLAASQAEPEPSLIGPQESLNRPLAHPSRRRQPVFSRDDTSGPRCYFCSLCGFNCEDELGIHAHQELFHPEVSVANLLHFLCVDKSLREKRKKVESTKVSGKNGRGRPKGSRNKNTLSLKERSKIERRKEAKLFKDRKHIPRIWEKPSGMPLTDEFMFAIGLTRKSDVLLGPRKRQSVISSSLVRNCRRAISPAPGMKKSVRVVMKRVSLQHKKVFLCDHCSFYSTSKTEVRRHRRNDHLKNLRQPQAAEEDGTSTNNGDESSGSKKAHKHTNGTFPPPSNLLMAALATAPGPSCKQGIPVQKFSCQSCNFSGFSLKELETHEVSHRSVRVQMQEVSPEVVHSHARSASASSASCSRAASPPRKKTKVKVD